MNDVSDLYTSPLIRWAGAITHTCPLSAPDATAEAVSRLCGAQVSVAITVKDQKIDRFSQSVSACLLGQASCALVSRDIEGCLLSDIPFLHRFMQDILTAEVSGFSREMLSAQLQTRFPQGKFTNLLFFLSLQSYKTRHPSILLVFRALEKAVEAIQGTKNHD